MTIFYGTRYAIIPRVFKALGNTHRRAILHLIATRRLTATQMGELVGLSQQSVSRHIAVLSRAELVGRLGWEGYHVNEHTLYLLDDFIRQHFGRPNPTRTGGSWLP
ncbi:MAG TPA: helix-turn-helix domain-containing protein [Coriobacteriia bacterium]